MANRYLSENIYSKLKEAIISLEISPGTQLREVELAQTYQTSRTPVREALRRLQSEGLVEMSPGRGASVGELSIREVLEAYEVRLVLEVYAVKQAIKKGIDPKQVQKLIDRINDVIDDPNTPEQVTERESLDIDLHTFIANSAGNYLLTKMILETRSLIHRVYNYLGSQGGFEKARDEHLQILKAMLAKDAETAGRMMEAHLRQAKARLLNAPYSLED